LTILGLFLFAHFESTDEALEIAKVLIPVESTLVASVTGYYFGSQP
jgi:hypothetical protein